MEPLEAILNTRTDCGCGRRHATATRLIRLGEGALAAIPAWLREQGLSAPLLIADARTMVAAGERVAALLSDAGHAASVHLLAEGHHGGAPVADEAAVEAARERIAATSADVVVAVGSGTVNDVAKMASTQRSLPYVTSPTAPSMNGYTSAIAAILKGGVKRTLPAQQPAAVFGDLRVLAAAPRVMRLAGFGDLCSKPYSNADWILAHRLRGEYYCDVPAGVLDGPFRELLTHADGIRTSDLSAVRKLTEVLLLSGFSMALAGSSAPASGGEHLLSHYWDMVEHAGGRPVRALHGVQVGVASVLCGRLYERVLGLPPDRLELAARGPATREERELEVRGRHPLLEGPILDEVVEQALGKFRTPRERREELFRLRREWADVRAQLRERWVPPAEVEAALKNAGAPVRAEALGIDGTTLAATLRVCRDIRVRFTILDLADELGILDEFADEMANRLD